MKEQWSKLKTGWGNLAAREQQAIAIGASLLGIFILYQWIWSPLVDHVAAMRKQMVAEKKLLVWMQTADKQIHKIEGTSQNKSKSVSLVMLLSLVQKQINHAGLEKNLSQLKQASNASITMHFQKVEFDKLIALLTIIIKEQHVSITQMSAVAENTPGIVNADVMLKIG